jgi:hypothetical protein
VKKSPFSVSKKLEIVPVGTADSGVIYLLKRGGITPNESPVDLQEATRRQAEVTMILMQAVKGCAEKEGISQKEARERVFPTPRISLYELVPIELAEALELFMVDAVQACILKEDCDPKHAREKLIPNRARTAFAKYLDAEKAAAFNAAIEQAIALAASPERSTQEAKKLIYEALLRPDVEVVEEVDLYDYLSADQTSKLLSLQEDGRNTAIMAATLFIQKRLAYPVVLTAEGKAKAVQLEIEPIRFPVCAGNTIRFGDCTIEVSGEVSFDSEILPIKALGQKLPANSVGFLLDISGKEKIGDEAWTIDDTKTYLTEQQIQSIFEFYQREVSGVETSPAQEGNSMTSLPSSESTLQKTLSTGEISTGEFSGLPSPTLGLVPINSGNK